MKEKLDDVKSAMKEGNLCLNGEINGITNDVSVKKQLEINSSDIKNGNSDILDKLQVVNGKSTDPPDNKNGDPIDSNIPVLNGKVSDSSRETTPSLTDNSREGTPVLKSRNSSRTSTPLSDSRCSTPTNAANMEVKKDEKVKDTNSSGKPVTKMPKARKSALPISKQSQEVVAKNMGLPPSNLTVKLPDFEAPIKLNSSMLEELSNLGRSGKSKPLGGQRTRASMGGSLNPPKIMRQRVTMGSSMGKNAKPPSKMPKLFPSVEKEPPVCENTVKDESVLSDSSSTSKIEGTKLLKIRSHKRKKRMGTYKLPLERKKSKTLKKKEKTNEDEEKDESEIKEENENNDENTDATDNLDSSMDQDKSVDVSMGLRTPNDKNIAQKTKNTLGSTRQGRTPPSAKKLPEHKGKPITEYFSVKSPSSSQVCTCIVTKKDKFCFSRRIHIFVQIVKDTHVIL